MIQFKNHTWRLPASHLPIYLKEWVHQRGDEKKHDHNFFEIVAIMGGSAEHRSDAGERPLVAGDIILLQPGVWHGYYDCNNLHIYNCCIGVEILKKHLAWTLQEPQIGALLAGPWTAAGQAQSLVFHAASPPLRRGCRILADLDAYLADTAMPHAARVISGLLLFLDELAYEYVRRNPAATLAGRKVPERIVAAIRILETEIAHAWTRDLLAGRVYCDPAHFGRLFKTATGLAPMHYLTKLRAERAADLLLRTQEPIGAIAALVGWPDIFHFARRFKAFWGVSATEYRNQLHHR
ncbi:MAG: AraC family transcriptional regulator [Planctomycetia bacterium]|nr:AraC family transcriptional regulator [Planctomycetia bacterium]